MLCEFSRRCYIYKEYKSIGKHKVSYSLYCNGRKKNDCARRDDYLDNTVPLKNLLPSGIHK